LAQRPRICRSDVPKQRILHHICINDLIEGEWPVLTGRHLEKREADANKQIDHDSAALFRAPNPHCLDGGNFIEASVDAK